MPTRQARPQKKASHGRWRRRKVSAGFDEGNRMAVYAETVLRNGTVWCGRSEGTAEAVALWGGRVLATGSDDDIAPLIGAGTKVVDLRGRLATPGLIDAH